MIQIRARHRFVLWLAAIGVIFINNACSGLSQRSAKKSVPISIHTGATAAGPGVEFQKKRTYAFEEAQVYFSNEFNSARLNEVAALNDSTFRVLIRPENEPINRSPWYAFKVWSPQRKTVELILDYGEVRHRYAPKHLLGRGSAWTDITNVSLNDARTEARFRVLIGPDTSWVSGQPIFNKDSIVNWLQTLGRRPQVTLRDIGRSTLGEVIYGYETAAVPSKKAILLLGGQHPPEFTGFQAQVAFVNFILGDHPLARRFREQYQIVGVPWINPDGNNLGHWRHNVSGVDLNRDWTSFIQKETQATRDFILGFMKAEGTAFVFGMDFHTTFQDILYTNNPHPDYQTHEPGLMDRWIAHWNTKLGDKQVPVRPSDAEGRVSKSWMFTELNAEAVTYEVADTTPLPVIRFNAEQAAIALIETLLVL